MMACHKVHPWAQCSSHAVNTTTPPPKACNHAQRMIKLLRDPAYMLRHYRCVFFLYNYDDGFVSSTNIGGLLSWRDKVTFCLPLRAPKHLQNTSINEFSVTCHEKSRRA